MRERSSENFLAIGQPLLSKLLQVFVVQSVSHGNVDVAPTVVPGLVPTNQQDGGAFRVEGVQGTQRPAAMLRAKFPHVTVLRSFDATAVRETQRRAMHFEQTHGGGQRFLLLFGLAAPPVAELIGVFDFSCHGVTVTKAEHSINGICAQPLDKSRSARIHLGRVAASQIHPHERLDLGAGEAQGSGGNDEVAVFQAGGWG
jgi:hypothetical protein